MESDERQFRTSHGGKPDGDGPVRPDEPDYRFVLANERTFLAWQRTSLGLLALSVALAQLAPSMLEPGRARMLGLALNVLAILSAGAGMRRWAQSERAIRQGAPLPEQLPPWYLGAGIVVACLIALTVTAAAR